jgi:hypothetical protein
MFAYIIPKQQTVHVASWPEYQRLAQAGPWSTTAIGGKTMIFRHSRDAKVQASRMSLDHYGAPVECGGMQFLPPKEHCALSEFARPENERPFCLQITLPVGPSRSVPMHLNVPVAQAQPRKICWSQRKYGDEPAGDYFRAAQAFGDAADAMAEAQRKAEKSPADAAAADAAYDEYMQAMLALVGLAIPLAYAVTTELMDWGQWIDEGDLQYIALAALGIDAKKNEQEAATNA